MMNKTDTYKIKTALISVSDKTGIVDFAKQLVELGIEIYSTGGTEQALHHSKIPCKSITSLTGFPESFDGRVKTLHPAIHAGLLAELDNPDHLSQLDKFGFKSIDLLVVNLYPFEEKLSQKDIQQKELIENIDNWRTHKCCALPRKIIYGLHQLSILNAILKFSRFLKTEIAQFPKHLDLNLQGKSLLKHLIMML